MPSPNLLAESLDTNRVAPKIPGALDVPAPFALTLLSPLLGQLLRFTGRLLSFRGVTLFLSDAAFYLDEEFSKAVLELPALAVSPS